MNELLQQTQLQVLGGLSALGKQAEKHYSGFYFHLFYFSIHPSQNIFGGFLILVGYRLSGVFAGKLTSGVFATLTSVSSLESLYWVNQFPQQLFHHLFSLIQLEVTHLE